jgi:hypothetical protein
VCGGLLKCEQRTNDKKNTLNISSTFSTFSSTLLGNNEVVCQAQTTLLRHHESLGHENENSGSFLHKTHHETKILPGEGEKGTN